MARSWTATGRLTPLYERVGGRDRLAELTGISGTTLSAYNSGDRPLGILNAQRIARAAGVTIEELGQPLSIEQRLERIEADIQKVIEAQMKTQQSVEGVLALVSALRRTSDPETRLAPSRRDKEARSRAPGESRP